MKVKHHCFSDSDESSLIQRFKHHILSLQITGEENPKERSVMMMRGDLFVYVFKVFTHIQRLKFFPDPPKLYAHAYFNDRPSISSSTLVELHINTFFFDHCLYLLDGGFDQLHTLIVNVIHFRSHEDIIHSTVSYVCASNHHRYPKIRLFLESDHQFERIFIDMLEWK